jgi:thymidylate kinase
MLAQAASTNDWDPIRDEMRRFQSLLRKALSFSVIHVFRENLRKLRRFFRPTGLMVVFLGPDCSGKSTIIGYAERNLAPLFRRTKVYHFRPHFGRKVRDDTPVTNPHGQRPRNGLSSCLKLLLYVADYSLGYFFIVWPRKVRSTLILFDRYFFDVVIDPKRLRYSGPQWMAYLAMRFIPAPDVIIYLDAPTAVLYSRKQELSASETERQREAYLDLTQNLQGARTVNASKPLPEVIADVERIVVDLMESRTMKCIVPGT